MTVLAGVVAFAALGPGVGDVLTGSLNGATDGPGGRSEVASGPQAAGTGDSAAQYALPERAQLGEPRAELFGSQSWRPPVPRVESAPPPAPVAPPLPYKYAGKLVQGGQFSILLSKGDAVFPVKEGETLDGAYRVEAVSETQVTLIYLPLKHRETVPIASALTAGGDAVTSPAAAQPAAQAPRQVVATPAAPSRGVPAPIPTSAVVMADPGASSKPAQLLWEGPQQVRIGTRFEVSLRVTSGQPLQASPMQLRFDPAFLEFVAARPGKFFGGGNPNFSYRANPDGSIFVGASSQNPVPVSDGELLVLIFRPVKSAPVAELSVSSLSLQGPAGRPIAVSQLEAFKTAISP